MLTSPNLGTERADIAIARQMIDLGRFREALDLAQTGVYAVRRSATPKTTALLLIIEARVSMASYVTSSRVTNRLLRTAELAHNRFPGASAIGELTARARALTVGMSTKER
jgi:hypothetical protein